MTEELMKNGRPRHAGLFKPGQSGNPLGRSKDSYRVSDLAKTHTEKALNTLVEIIEDKKAPPAARVQAATAILDRGWGKPVQQIEKNEVHTFFELVQMVEEAEKRYQEAITCEVKEIPQVITSKKLEDLI